MASLIYRRRAVRKTPAESLDCNWLLRCAALLSYTWVVVAHVDYTTYQHAPKPSSAAAAELHHKWSAAEVVRDLEHIKQDVAKMLHLQSIGELSPEEVYFYYFRMHDFDENNLLDGHELKAAMLHTVAHHPGGENSVPEAAIAAYVDAAMKSDANQDGFISYPEIRAAM
uniref:EF-hand domain-containing protein n=1 Tax=Rhipicephalus pulchellus TaxID=72859 RepID=L7M060_RHIPC